MKTPDLTATCWSSTILRRKKDTAPATSLYSRLVEGQTAGIFYSKAVFTLRTTSYDIVRCRTMSCAVWTPLKYPVHWYWCMGR